MVTSGRLKYKEIYKLIIYIDKTYRLSYSLNNYDMDSYFGWLLNWEWLWWKQKDQNIRVILVLKWFLSGFFLVYELLIFQQLLSRSLVQKSFSREIQISVM